MLLLFLLLLLLMVADTVTVAFLLAGFVAVVAVVFIAGFC